MRVLALAMVAALAGSPAAQGTMCRCSREATKPTCCCGDASTGTCCCTGESTRKRGGRALRACMCSEIAPRAIERPAVDTPAIATTPVVAVCASRPVAVERAAAPREVPAPLPGFRPPLLL